MLFDDARALPFRSARSNRPTSPLERGDGPPKCQESANLQKLRGSALAMAAAAGVKGSDGDEPGRRTIHVEGAGPIANPVDSHTCRADSHTCRADSHTCRVDSHTNWVHLLAGRHVASQDGLEKGSVVMVVSM
eukprot:1176404-Prorocentrum_minimum.AAC.4